MAMGEIARCWKCNTLASGDELVMDKSTAMYDYKCLDEEACEARTQVITSGPNKGMTLIDAMRKRKGYKSGLRKIA